MFIQEGRERRLHPSPTVYPTTRKERGVRQMFRTDTSLMKSHWVVLTVATHGTFVMTDLHVWATGKYEGLLLLYHMPPEGPK